MRRFSEGAKRAGAQGTRRVFASSTEPNVFHFSGSTNLLASSVGFQSASRFKLSRFSLFLPCLPSLLQASSKRHRSFFPSFFPSPSALQLPNTHPPHPELSLTMISHPQPTTLLQTALLSSKLQAASLSSRGPTSHGSDEVESDDESLVGVQTPLLRSPSRQGGSLPSTSLSRSREPISLKTSSDPIKAFSSEIGESERRKEGAGRRASWMVSYSLWPR